MYANRDLNSMFRHRTINDSFNTEKMLQTMDVDVTGMRNRLESNKPLSLTTFPFNRIEHNGFNVHEPVKLEGPYKHTYPRKFKELIVQQAGLFGIKATCKKFNVTRKNVERWCKNGLDRKKGAGRKTTNPEMELEILNWVEDYIRRERKIPKRNYIIIRAMEYADGAFKASKGWCDKFLKRNKSILEQYMAEAKVDEKIRAGRP